MEVESGDLEQSDEDYLISCANNCLPTNPYDAKSWIATAKSLYPDNFKIQYEAYCIEKSIGDVKQAANNFGDLVMKFQHEHQVCKEIEEITMALRSESECATTNPQFLCEMFHHLSGETQHQLLLFTADRCEDTMEHCRLLLLLLQKFPPAISTHGPRLIDTLLSAEKHGISGNKPINCYRKMLVCELLPLLGENTQIEFSTKLLFRLLHKSIEFYLIHLLTPGTFAEDDTKVESSEAESWEKLFKVLELTGRHLGWEPQLITFNKNWSKESYWQKLLAYYQSHQTSIIEDHNSVKQVLHCATIFFLYCLHKYFTNLSPEAAPGQTQINLILVEAFKDSNLPYPQLETGTKRKKLDTDIAVPYITVDKPGNKAIGSNLSLAVNCWDLLHSAEHLQREFIKLSNHLKIDSLLTKFVIEYDLYKGRYEDALLRLQQVKDSTQILEKNIKLASVYFSMKNYAVCFDHILFVMPSLPTSNAGKFSDRLTVGGNQRHLHFLPLTNMAIVQYCTRLLFNSIRETQQKGVLSDMAIGNLFVLMQLDWPQLEDLFPPMIEYIKQKRSFQYPLFQPYILNVDMLEEFMYLWSEQGGQIQLDINPLSLSGSQRRIGTRGADKGAREEIRQIIKRQIAKSHEPTEQTVKNFLANEKMSILQCLIILQ